MLATVDDKRASVASVAEAALCDLISLRHWEQSSFINLPLIYPSGSHVTVKLDPAEVGFRVSDNGFAYREVEAIGAERSFPNAAHRLAATEGLSVNRRAIYVEVSEARVVRAICDVAIASWRTAERIYTRASEGEEEELEETLRDRLRYIFGDRLLPERRLKGATTTEWEVSALVAAPAGVTVFHAVSDHPNSINRASAGFLDLSGTENPPHLVAVVNSKASLGPRLGLLSQAGGRVIERGQTDAVYMRAAA